MNRRSFMGMLVAAPAAIALGIAGIKNSSAVQWVGKDFVDTSHITAVLVEAEEETFRRYSGYETLDISH